MELNVTSLPVPRDLPLPLPLPENVLQVLLVVFFLAHILFVNLIVGGSLLVFCFEALGFRNLRWDRLSHAVAGTITVNKSVAVVLGIGPLLCINLLYTIQWYSANALTGHAWLLLIPAVTVAFLLTYLHKYSWEHWSTGQKKYLHFVLGGVSALLFLFIPLIFLSNINLMLFPETWQEVRGFLSSLRIANVFPRYIHFLLASIAVTFLFLVGCVRKSLFGFTNLDGFSDSELIRFCYRGVAISTLIQFVAGPLLLFTLPAVGISTSLYILIFAGAALAVPLLWILRREINATEQQIGKLFTPICILFSVIVLCMGSGRAVYRKSALALHTELITKRSEQYEKALDAFRNNTVERKTSSSLLDSGEAAFAVCGACHAYNQKLVGPPLTEIAAIYSDNPAGIVAWTKSPGKRRPDYPQMPAMAHLGDEQLTIIAEYMLRKGIERD